MPSICHNMQIMKNLKQISHIRHSEKRSHNENKQTYKYIHEIHHFSFLLFVLSWKRLVDDWWAAHHLLVIPLLQSCQFFLSLRQQSTQDLLCSVDGYFCTISALPPQKIWGDVNSHKFCTYHQFYLWDQIFFLKLRGLLQSNWSILCPSSLFPALSLLQHGLAVVLCRVVILA